MVQKLKSFVKSAKKNKHKETGQGRSKCKFFNKLNEILGMRPATHSPKVLDTLDGSTIHTENGLQANEEHDQSDTSGHNDDNEGLDNTGDEGSNGTSSSNSTTDVLPVGDIQSVGKSTTSESSSSKAVRKQKRTKGEIMEEMMTNVLKAVTGCL